MPINKLPEPGEPVCVHGYSLLHDCIACDEEPKPQAPSAEWLAGWRACREAAAEAADLAAAVDNGPDDYGDGMNRGASLVAAAIRALTPPKARATEAEADAQNWKSISVLHNSLRADAEKDLREAEAKLARVMKVVEAAKSGITPLPEFLEWVAARFVGEHNESPNVDFVRSLRYRAERFRVALKDAPDAD